MKAYRIKTDQVIVPDNLRRDTGLPGDPQGDIRTGYAERRADLMALARLDRANGGAGEIDTVWHMRQGEYLDYCQICEELGMRSDINFVRVTDSGRIGCYAGKPDEVATLRYRAERAGFRMVRL